MLPKQAIDRAAGGSAESEPATGALTLLEMQRELLAEATAGARAGRVLELLVEFIESYSAGAAASVLLLDERTQTLSTLVATAVYAAVGVRLLVRRDGFPVGRWTGTAIGLLSRGNDVRMDAGTTLEMVIQREVALDGSRVPR